MKQLEGLPKTTSMKAPLKTAEANVNKENC